MRSFCVLACTGFRKRFNFTTASWDWKENALQTIAEQLMAGFATVESSFFNFMERAQMLSLRPMNWVNFQRFFSDIDAVLQLRLRPFEWKELFHAIDEDDDGVINDKDFCKTFRCGFENFGTGRVTPVHGKQVINLSSAEVFRRADKLASGFLTYNEFKVGL